MTDDPDERLVLDVVAEVDAKMTLNVEPGDIVTDVVVLARVQRLDSTSDLLLIGTSGNTGGMTQYGIVCSAKLQIEDWMINGVEDDFSD